MSLQLRLIAYKGLAPVEPLTFDVGDSGGTIGRAQDIEFILPDPEKLVSRKHASIARQDGSWILSDNSAAGTYVLNRDLLLQRDSVALTHGDRLKIGDYELLVEIGGDPSAKSTFWDDAHTESPTWSLASGRSELAPPAVGDSSESDLVARTEPSFIEQPDAAPERSSFVPPGLVPEPGEADGVPDFDLEDLLREVEAPSSPPVSNAETQWQIPDDLVSNLRDLEPAVPEPGAVNVATAEPESAAIAQDSSGSSMSVSSAAEGEFLAQTPEFVDSVRAEPSVSLDAESRGASCGDLSPVHADRPEATDVPPFRIPSPSASAIPPPVAEYSLNSTSAGEDRAGQPGTEKAVAPTEHPAKGPDLFRLFLEGAGIDELPGIREEQVPELMRKAGTLFQQLVDGMMAVLRARTEEKRELRVAMTMMRPMNNNPLKATPTPDLAIKLMLGTNHPGFLPAGDAIREAFRDLIAHQMATTAGIQASLSQSLSRFDPKSFEQRIHDGMFFQKKGKCWDAYCKAYPDLVNEAIENLFGEEFAEVYEQQIRNVRSAADSGK